MREFEDGPVVATEQVSPELALIDPGLRQRALILEELARIEERWTLLAQPSTPALAGLAQPASHPSVSLVLLYSTARLLEVLTFGAVVALALAVLVAALY